MKQIVNFIVIMSDKLEVIMSDKLEGLVIEPAKREDAEIVAWTVLTALDMPTDELDWVLKSCKDEKSMYSWNKALIAKINGENAGCIVSYKGDDYKNLREYTWGNLWTDVDSEFIRNTPYETAEGEYYLDSMAILPKFRGNELGKKLIQAAIEKGKESGYQKFSLIVDITKPGLIKYYESIGFHKIGELPFFGHNYWKMQLQIS